MADDDWDESLCYTSTASEPFIDTQSYSRGGARKPRQNGYNERDNRRDRGQGFNSNRPRENGGNWRSSNEASNAETMSVESSIVGKIIGRGGTKIRELESSSGARIKVNKPTSTEPWATNIDITGSEEAVAKAQELIRGIVDDRPPPPQTSTREEEFEIIDWEALNRRAEEARAAKWAKAPPMKKNFYFEDPEVKNMDPKFVKEFRLQKNKITVQNFSEDEHIPNPVTTFEQAFRNYPEIMREIEKNNFLEPSPIQCQAWPVLLSGRDLIGIAQTGTGKTLAFLLPALIHIDGQPVPREERTGPNVLIIAPTRELAQQIEDEVRKYSYKGIRSVCVYGGGSRRDQVSKVSSGVEIVIATAGRLNDLVDDGIIELSAVTYLVLDEADRMLDMGFEPQIRKVLLDIRPDRQSVMTSATWPPLVHELAGRYMKNPVQVFVGSLDLAAVHSVTQTILICDKEEKRDYLDHFIQTLGDDDKVIVFVGRKAMADHISSDLGYRGIDVQSIHGDRCQEDREAALRDLKSGNVRILIATDVASRGIDILDITKVFNFDFPRNIEEYVHRVGRTGRAGRTGEAISLFTREDWGSAGELIDILTEANQLVPDELYNMKQRFEDMKIRKDEERDRARAEIRHSDSLSGGFRGRGGGGRGGRGGRRRDDDFGGGWGGGGRRGGKW